jgi:small subunit ribosomal protein S11
MMADTTTAPEQLKDTTAKPAPKPRRRKVKRSVPTGQVHIQATFNNTIITFTDPKGKVVSWSSAGAAGFKGSRKGTAYAAQIACEKAAEIAKNYGFSEAEVLVKGIGLGREAAIRVLQNIGIHVSGIKDVTGVPHNGCRPRRARRI